MRFDLATPLSEEPLGKYAPKITDSDAPLPDTSITFAVLTRDTQVCIC